MHAVDIKAYYKLRARNDREGVGGEEELGEQEEKGKWAKE